MGHKKEEYKTTEEWLEAREGYLTGTIASAIMGESADPEKDMMWVYKYLKGYPIKENDKGFSEEQQIKINKGKAMEEHIFSLFSIQYQDKFKNPKHYDNTLFTNDKYPRCKASLDGTVEDMEGNLGVVEIKTAFFDCTHPSYRDKRLEQWDKNLPRYYYWQLLHYMMIMEAEFGVLAVRFHHNCKGKEQCEEILSCQIPNFSSTMKTFYIPRELVQNDIDLLIYKINHLIECVEGNKIPTLSF